MTGKARMSGHPAQTASSTAAFRFRLRTVGGGVRRFPVLSVGCSYRMKSRLPFRCPNGMAPNYRSARLRPEPGLPSNPFVGAGKARTRFRGGTARVPGRLRGVGRALFVARTVRTGGTPFILLPPRAEGSLPWHDLRCDRILPFGLLPPVRSADGSGDDRTGRRFPETAIRPPTPVSGHRARRSEGTNRGNADGGLDKRGSRTARHRTRRA